MHQSDQDHTAAVPEGSVADLRAEVAQLAQRLDALESEVVTDRALHRRVAELADVVEQLLLAADRQRDQGFASRVRRYVSSL